LFYYQSLTDPGTGPGIMEGVGHLELLKIFYCRTRLRQAGLFRGLSAIGTYNN
jgi:hypothetical protein